MPSFTTLLALITVLTSAALLANAHPGEVHEMRSVKEQRAHTQRSLEGTKCASQAKAMREARKLARRGLIKRQEQTDPISAPQHVTETNNATCVLTPEAIEGPYYVRNEFVRSDLREDQPGLELILDIGVLDINTCEPLSNAFVEIWACNTTGIYSGYTAAILDVPEGIVITADSVSPVGTLTDNLSWLRGGMATTPQGIVELTTIYPGWYEGRTVHIHTMIRTNYTVLANGTLSSGDGGLVHVGQMYFDDDLTTQVGSLAPYTTTTQPRTKNGEDFVFVAEKGTGNDPVAEHSLLGDSIEDGILSYITIGVDTQASYVIHNDNVQEK